MQAKLIAQHLGADFLNLIWFHLAQPEGAIADADQAVHGEVDVIHRAADFAVAPFAQTNCQPGVGALMAVHRDGHGLEAFAINRDALSQGFQINVCRVAFDAYAVFAQPAGGWKFKAALEFAIIGQQQQPFGVQVKPADGHDAGHILGQVFEHRGAALFIRGGRNQPLGFVIQPQARGLGGTYKLAFDGDLVGWQYVQGRRADGFAVDGDKACFDHPLSLTSGGDACTGQHLGNTVTGRCGACGGGFGGGFGCFGHGAGSFTGARGGMVGER